MTEDIIIILEENIFVDLHFMLKLPPTPGSFSLGVVGHTVSIFCPELIWGLGPRVVGDLS